MEDNQTSPGEYICRDGNSGEPSGKAITLEELQESKYVWRTRGEAIKKRYRRGKLDQFFNDLVKKKECVLWQEHKEYIGGK